MLTLEGIGWQLDEGEEILRDVSLEIPDGKMTVVTGPNGGGKTSLAKIIAGLAVPTRGKLYLDGEDITEWDITERARHGISYAFQQPVRFKGLSVRDLLEISAEQKLTRGQVCEYLGEVGLCAEEYVDLSLIHIWLPGTGYSRRHTNVFWRSFPGAEGLSFCWIIAERSCWISWCWNSWAGDFRSCGRRLLSAAAP